jgi:hypothetical protein
MIFESDGDNDYLGKLQKTAIIAHPFDYERVWRIGDPAQAELADFLSERIPVTETTNFHIMAYSFLNARNASCHDIWSGIEQAKNLRSLKKKIGEISKIYNSLPEFLVSSLLVASSGTVELENEELATDVDRAQNYLKTLYGRATPGLQGYSGLQILAKYSDSLISAFDKAIKDTIVGIPQGNKAIEAWRYVDACEHICSSISVDIKVPSFLGPSGDFYRLLSDVFHLYEIENDPVDMFKAWRKHVGSSEKKSI